MKEIPKPVPLKCVTCGGEIPFDHILSGKNGAEEGQHVAWCSSGCKEAHLSKEEKKKHVEHSQEFVKPLVLKKWRKVVKSLSPA